MNELHTPVHTVLVLVARLCLAFFFCPSAFGKLTNHNSFINGVIDYQILPEHSARVLGFILPWIELGLAVALIFGVALPAAGLLTSLLLICFIIAVTINLRRGRTINCNCYGIANTTTISWGTVVRNLLLLLLAIVVAVLSPQALGLNRGLTLWRTDLTVMSSIASATLVMLLLSFCIVAIQLVEWAVDIYFRISKFNRVIE